MLKQIIVSVLYIMHCVSCSDINTKNYFYQTNKADNGFNVKSNDGALSIIKPQQEWKFKSKKFKHVSLYVLDEVKITYPHRRFISLIPVLSRHESDYSEEACQYSGRIRLDNINIENAEFVGIPFCAFGNDSYIYFLTRSPFIYFVENDKLIYSSISAGVCIYCYNRKDKRLSEIGDYTGINPTDHDLTETKRVIDDIITKINFCTHYQKSFHFYDTIALYSRLLLNYYLAKSPHNNLKIWNDQKIASIQRESLDFFINKLSNNPQIAYIGKDEFEKYIANIPEGRFSGHFIGRLLSSCCFRLLEDKYITDDERLQYSKRILKVLQDYCDRSDLYDSDFMSGIRFGIKKIQRIILEKGHIGHLPMTFFIEDD